MRRQLADIAGSQHGAFAWRQARQFYTSEEIRSRLSSGRWIRLFRGVYRTAGCTTSVVQRVMAAQLALGRPVVACHETAAAIHGFGVVHSAALHIAMSNECATHRRVGLRVHVPQLDHADVVCRDGVLVTGPARTAVDLARVCTRDNAIAALDAALREGAVTDDELRAELHRHAGARGIVQARELVPLADERAESPPESVLRLLCHDSGLPRPIPQLVVIGDDGRAHRLDLGWEEQRLAAEYEGLESHSGPAALVRDYARHNRLTALGWTMIYVTQHDLRSGRHTLVARLRHALRQV